MLRPRWLAIVELCMIVMVSWNCSSTDPSEADSTSPVCVLTYPPDELEIDGDITIRADATDNQAVESVSFSVDGQVISEDSSAPFEAELYATYWADGSTHTIKATAEDHAGNLGYSNLVTISISETAEVSPIDLTPEDGAVLVDPDGVVLAWSPLGGAVEYQVQLAQDPSFAVGVVEWQSGSNSLTITQDIGHYYWHVRGVNSTSQYSGWSEVSEFDLIVEEHWSRTYGGVASDMGYSILTSTSDGYVVGGYTKLEGNSTSSGWVFSIDHIGQVLWSVEFGWGDYGWDMIRCVEESLNGDILVSGNENWWGEAQMAIVYTLSSEGQVISMRDYWWAEEASALAVAASSDGGFLVGGYYSYDDERYSCIFKVDSNGEEEWNRVFGEGPHEKVCAIEQVDDGGYVLVGSIAESHGLLKIDSSGETLWDLSSESFSLHGRSLSVSEVGDIFITGQGSGTTLGIAKVSSNGVVIWHEEVSVPSGILGFGVFALQGGGCVVTGETHGGLGSWDLLFRMYSDDGAMIHEYAYGGENADVGYDITQSNDGGYLIVGQTDSFGDTDGDLWLVKTNEYGECPTALFQARNE